MDRGRGRRGRGEAHGGGRGRGGHVPSQPAGNRSRVATAVQQTQKPQQAVTTSRTSQQLGQQQIGQGKKRKRGRQGDESQAERFSPAASIEDHASYDAPGAEIGSVSIKGGNVQQELQAPAEVRGGKLRRVDAPTAPTVAPPSLTSEKASAVAAVVTLSPSRPAASAQAPQQSTSDRIPVPPVQAPAVGTPALEVEPPRVVEPQDTERGTAILGMQAASIGAGASASGIGAGPSMPSITATTTVSQPADLPRTGDGLSPLDPEPDGMDEDGDAPLTFEALAGMPLADAVRAVSQDVGRELKRTARTTHRLLRHLAAGMLRTRFPNRAQEVEECSRGAGK